MQRREFLIGLLAVSIFTPVNAASQIDLTKPDMIFDFGTSPKPFTEKTTELMFNIERLNNSVGKSHMITADANINNILASSGLLDYEQIVNHSPNYIGSIFGRYQVFLDNSLKQGDASFAIIGTKEKHKLLKILS